MNLTTLHLYLFVSFVALIGFSTKVKKLHKYYKIGIYFILLLGSTLLLARDPLAPNDAYNYIIMYNNSDSFRQIFNAYHGNYFFSFTQFIGNYFNVEAERFLLIQSFLLFLLTLISFRLIFRESHEYLLGISLFLLTSTFILLYTNVIRQGLALSLLFLALGFFLRKSYINSYLAMALSFFSHYSAIIFILFIFTQSFIKINNRSYFYILITPLVIAPAYYILPNLSNFFSKIDTFSEKSYENALVYAKIFILYISLILFFYLGKKNNLFSIKKYSFLFKIYWLLVIFTFFTLPVLLLASRFLYYASALMPLLFTIVIFRSKSSLRISYRLFISFISTLIYGYFVYSYSSTQQMLGIYF
ncbi:EpsG family protein [Thiothrix nivea]|uniref:EpsG family protein n=1 Tax=Thiothrix nivea (strain ATCC 35100 / DSM 5205 / JP2) TaxID=870187 RepID=A0A656HFP8_THINJ|nr:hypothetical protein Thini_1626 [Thiothrix nivea DSM 5205]